MTRKTEIGDQCPQGHIIEGANAFYYNRVRSTGIKSVLVRCKTCYKADQRKNMQKRRSAEGKSTSLPFNRDEWYREYRRKRALDAKLAAEEHTELVDMSIKDDKKATAPWNYLSPEGRALDALEVLNDALATGRSKCFKNPGPYSDYEDENPPNITEARELCAGCPFIEQCKAYGMASRDRGVWGGIRVDEKGKVFG